MLLLRNVGLCSLWTPPCSIGCRVPLARSSRPPGSACLRHAPCSEECRWLELAQYSPPAGSVCLRHAPCSEECRRLQLPWHSPPAGSVCLRHAPCRTPCRLEPLLGAALLLTLPLPIAPASTRCVGYVQNPTPARGKLIQAGAWWELCADCTRVARNPSFKFPPCATWGQRLSFERVSPGCLPPSGVHSLPPPSRGATLALPRRVGEGSERPACTCTTTQQAHSCATNRL